MAGVWRSGGGKIEATVLNNKKILQKKEKGMIFSMNCF